jgi:hypothetical protein
MGRKGSLLMRKAILLARISQLERLLRDAQHDYLALQRENWMLQTKLADKPHWSNDR